MDKNRLTLFRPRTAQDDMDSIPIKEREEILRALFMDMSHNTVEAYKDAYQQFEEVTGRNVAHAGFKDIHTYYQFLRENGYSDVTISGRLAALSSFYKKAMGLNLLKANPVETFKATLSPGRLKIQKGSRTSDLKSEEVDAVIRETDDDIARAMILFLKYSGARVSEMLELTLDDITKPDKDGISKITLHGKGEKDRDIRLPFKLIKKVARLIGKDENTRYLFHNGEGGHILRQTAHKYIRNAFLKVLGLDVHPHELRHYFATQKVREGKDIKAISKWLGHESVQITLDYYVDTRLSDEDILEGQDEDLLL